MNQTVVTKHRKLSAIKEYVRGDLLPALATNLCNIIFSAHVPIITTKRKDEMLKLKHVKTILMNYTATSSIPAPDTTSSLLKERNL